MDYFPLEREMRMIIELSQNWDAWLDFYPEIRRKQFGGKQRLGVEGYIIFFQSFINAGAGQSGYPADFFYIAAGMGN
jgi:hypothetical protein